MTNEANVKRNASKTVMDVIGAVKNETTQFGETVDRIQSSAVRAVIGNGSVAGDLFDLIRVLERLEQNLDCFRDRLAIEIERAKAVRVDLIGDRNALFSDEEGSEQ